MNLLLLGKGKTGSIVAEVARQRGHDVTAVAAEENIDGAALTTDKLSAIDVVIDFTAPDAVIGNIEACVRAGKNMVVGTTGWYGELERVGQLARDAGTGFVYGSNFSIGVNLFFDIAKTATAALDHGYHAKIIETHHIHKKDAPSGTAAMLRRVMQTGSGQELPVESIREGEVVGIHTVVLEAEGDTITLTHAAKSRRGFADGAVRAAEWICGKQGVFDFKDVFREL